MKSRRSRKTLSAHELDLFLHYLSRTGNFAFACDRLGRAKSGLYKRRARDPDFDEQCRHAIARSRSHLWQTGEPKARSSGGKPETVLGTYAGRPQLRRAAPGAMTRVGEQAFLTALAATGNIRLAARSIGIAHSSILHRRETRPGFARAMDEALHTATAMLQLRVIELSRVLSDKDADPPPGAIGALSVHQALRYLEQSRQG